MKSPRALALLLIVGCLAALGSSSSAAAQTKTFTLNLGGPGKVKTGIVLKDGAKVKLTVSGDGKCGEGSDCPAGNPSGSGQTCSGRALGPLDPGPAPNLAYGAVAAQVGTAPAVATGSAKTVSGKGELLLFYNDCDGYYDDNTGSFTVKATYGSQLRISGTVIRRKCADKACKTLKVIPVKGQQVELKRKGHTYETQTDKTGSYRFRVNQGKYQVHLLGTTKQVEPDTRSVNATEDVAGLDFTLCKLPAGYSGGDPGCELVKVEGEADDFYGEAVSGPEISSDTDIQPIKGGAFSLYASRGSGLLEEHRLDRAAHPDDVETFHVSTGQDVNRVAIKLLPQITYLDVLPNRARIEYEAWNLPYGPDPELRKGLASHSYIFEIFGANRTTPSNIVCALDGGGSLLPADSDSDASLFEDLSELYPEKIEEPGFDKPVERFCKATYFGRIKDRQGNILARKAVPSHL
jgi:hypothetical protein